MTRKHTQAVIKRSLFADIRRMIEEARSAVAVTVNAGTTILYWQVGSRIRKDILQEKRAEYGEEILRMLSARLGPEFGRGFGEKNLRRMVQFAEAFPDEQIVAALLRQLGWTHFTMIIPFKDPLQRDFYAEMCRIEGWSTRTLRKKINGMLYERTALSKKPGKLVRQELEALREEDKLTPDLVFKDPLLSGLPWSARHLCREGSGSRDPQRDRTIPSGDGRGLHFCRAAKAHSD
jgi:DUF1016 N-terminal domain